MNGSDRRIARESGPAAAVARIAEPLLAGMGYRLVRVRMAGRDLQVMAERPDGSLTIDDCVAITRALSPVLDVEDPVPGPYNLEVSSPGVARPLVRPEDFERWAGFEARIEMDTPIDGRRRFRGVLEGYDAASDEVRIHIPAEAAGGEEGAEILIGLPFSDIASASLVMSDALLAEAGRRAAAHRGEAAADGVPMDVSEAREAGDRRRGRRRRRRGGTPRAKSGS